ncbi:MAG: class I SAM-dependent DNA methyltransferase [Actinomycetota bacterium]
MDEEYTYATYGDRIAEIYDQRYLERFEGDTAGAVVFLRPLAGDGPALELGIGTGRVAVPLAAEGVEVRGIDSSEAMVAKLHAKPGGARIDVTIGSFADFSVDERFPLIYVVFNTFFGLLTQDEQVSCFEAVARHLTPDGVFVMQAFVPDLSRYDSRHQRVGAVAVGPDEVNLETTINDPFEQRTDSQHVVIRDGSVRLYPVRIRYAYVSELDLMARIAGLRLRERWADWDRSPFPGGNWQHISVWDQAS